MIYIYLIVSLQYTFLFFLTALSCIFCVTSANCKCKFYIEFFLLFFRLFKCSCKIFKYCDYFLCLVQSGLRGIFVYTYDKSFSGAELFSQEIDVKAFEKLFASKDLISKPKSLQTSYDFLSLIDGRCGKFSNFMIEILNKTFVTLLF